jgi:hypothetical protein
MRQIESARFHQSDHLRSWKYALNAGKRIDLLALSALLKARRSSLIHSTVIGRNQNFDLKRSSNDKKTLTRSRFERVGTSFGTSPKAAYADR